MTRSHGVQRGKAIVLAALVAVFTIAVLVVPSAGAKTSVIKMKLDNEGLRFKGPDKIHKGDKLEIKNTTDPQQIGPHTFTLVKKKLLPTTQREGKKCFDRHHICRRVLKAHKVNFQTGEAKKPVIDKGKNGWDKSWSKKHGGDSWLTDAKGDTHVRRIKADAGRTLYYMCTVHPEMQGKIKVK
jgi:hypothetical protein